ncbi:hypothetical protein ACHAW6_001685 [Cyclotella cf. meneghiniana]
MTPFFRRTVWLVLVHMTAAWSLTIRRSTQDDVRRSTPVRTKYGTKSRRQTSINMTLSKQKKSHPQNYKYSSPKQLTHPKRADTNDLTGQSSREKTVVILYHKPPNVITSHSNMDMTPSSISERRRTVYEEISTMQGFVDGTGNFERNETKTSITDAVRNKRRGSFQEVTGIKSKLHAIGRLDADTTGALLLTNDGALVHRITNPNSNDRFGDHNNQSVQKTYEAVIMGHHNLSNIESMSNSTITNPLCDLLVNGVTLPQKYGGRTRPVDSLSILSHPSRTTTCVSITISEGKNRQVRRMFHAIGSGVMKLHRVSVGGITLQGLKEGEWRLLTEDEILKDLGYECRYLDTKFVTFLGQRTGAKNSVQQKQGKRQTSLHMSKKKTQ